MSDETLTVVVTKVPGTAEYTASIDGTDLEQLRASSVGAVFLKLGGLAGVGESLLSAHEAGLSKEAQMLVVVLALKEGLDSLETSLKQSPGRLEALKEVRELIRAERIPFDELRVRILGSLQGIPLVRPVPETDQIEAEINAAIKAGKEK